MRNESKRKLTWMSYGLVVLILGLGYIDTPALGSTASTTSVRANEPDINKDLRLAVQIEIETINGAGAVKAEVKMGVNYEEQNEVLLGDKRIIFAPSKTSGESEMLVTVLGSEGRKIYESKVPLNGKAEIQAKLNPNPENIYRIAIKMVQF